MSIKFLSINRLKKIDILFILVAIVILIFYCVQPLKYYLQFQLNTFDYGVQFNSTEAIARFHDTFMTTRGLYAFADNQDYLQFFLAWLHYLPSPHQAVILFHSLGIFAVGVLIYLCGRSRPDIALGIATFYWLSPFAVNINLDLVHTESFATFFLVALYFAAKRGYRKSFYLFFGLALISKEDVAFTLLVFLFVMKVKASHFKLQVTDLKRSLLMILSVMAFDFVVLTYYQNLSCHHLTGNWVNSGLRHSSPWFEGLWQKLFSLSELRKMYFSQEAFIYLAMLFGPLIILGTQAYPWILIALPGAMINLTGGLYLIQGLFHYDHSTLAGILIALIEVLSHLRFSRLRVAFLVGVTLFFHTSWYPRDSFSKLNQRLADMVRPNFWNLEKAREVKLIESLNSLLPQDVVISADHRIVSYLLPERFDVYMFENPFFSLNFGVYGSCDGNQGPLSRLPEPDLLLLTPQTVVRAELIGKLNTDYVSVGFADSNDLIFRVYVRRASPRSRELLSIVRIASQWGG